MLETVDFPMQQGGWLPRGHRMHNSVVVVVVVVVCDVMMMMTDYKLSVIISSIK